MASITQNAHFVQIHNAYKDFTGSSGNTTTVIQYASGDAPASGDAGRFLLWQNGAATKDWEIRFIESATSTTVTVGDGGFSSAPPNSANFAISTNLDDVVSAVSGVTVTNFSYNFNGRFWQLSGGAFLADVNKSIDTENQLYTNSWQVGNGCAVQFGRLDGGEANGSTITRQGCFITLNSSKTSANQNVFGSGYTEVSNGPIINFYGCYIKSYTSTAANWAFVRGTGPIRFIGTIWDGPIGGAFYHSASELVDTKFRGNVDLIPAWSIRATFTRPVENAQFANALAAFKTFTSYTGTFRNTVFDLNSLPTVVFVASNPSGGVTCIDCTTFDDTKVSDTTANNSRGFIHQAKSINYTVTDSAGTGLNGALVGVRDNTGAVQGGGVKTSTGGSVPEIVAIFYRFTDNPPSSNRAPFDIIIRKYGYIYRGFSSAVSDPIKSEIRLSNNSQLVSTEAQAAAIAGISLNFATSTLTITSNTTTQQLYDYYQYQLAQDDPQLVLTAKWWLEDLVRSGDSFDLSDWDMIVDGATYTGSVTTTGTITLQNGAELIGTRTDTNGTTTVTTLTLTGLQANTEVRVFDAGTTTEVAGVENSGTTFSANLDESSVDIVLHAIGYEYQKIEGADTSANLTLPISQRFDRNYRNP